MGKKLGQMEKRIRQSVKGVDGVGDFVSCKYRDISLLMKVSGVRISDGSQHYRPPVVSTARGRFYVESSFIVEISKENAISCPTMSVRQH